MIIGITGLCEDLNGNVRIAGAGKDSVASRLVKKHGFVRIGLADPLKRICQEVFEFTDEQLWGPSEMRNAPDFRYPRGSEKYRTAHRAELDAAWNNENDPAQFAMHKRLADGYAQEGWLSPRFALQQLGTEWGRFCYTNVWVDYALRAAKQLAEGGFYYDEKTGVRSFPTVEGVMEPKTNATFSDLRFYNEYKAVREAGGKLIRVRRKIDTVFRDTHLDKGHQSEVELVTLADECFDHVIENFGTLDTLDLLTDRMMDVFKGKIRAYDEAQADVPPFMRSTTREP